MALFNYQYCLICDKQTGHINNNCSDCASRAALELKQKADKHWNSLSVEGKLDFLRSRLDNIDDFNRNNPKIF